MKRLKNIHPGEILQEEFLTPMNITAYRLAKETHIPQTRISEILKGNRRITADTALRLSIYFGTTPKFWLGLQDDYDIEEERRSAENNWPVSGGLTHLLHKADKNTLRKLLSPGAFNIYKHVPVHDWHVVRYDPCKRL